MSRTYYTDYVRHALRFYSRNTSRPVFRSDVDKNNWLSCESVLNKYPTELRETLIEIYAGHDTLPDEVYLACKKRNIEQNHIWDTMKIVEQSIAHRRGLL